MKHNPNKSRIEAYLELEPRTSVKNRILLVEDSDINRRLFQDLLEVNGYIVCSLSNGLKFFQAITEFSPDLILLDLKMPQVDGYTLLQQLQESPVRSIPVVVVSAYGLERERQKALNLGARAYLTKPVAVEDVVRTVEIELN